uniref:Uncharacterized protein n=1 Tax=Arundo donax TaxID=35708 RepID=A0A0A9GL93_ARUDO
MNRPKNHSLPSLPLMLQTKLQLKDMIKRHRTYSDVYHASPSSFQQAVVLTYSVYLKGETWTNKFRFSILLFHVRCLTIVEAGFFLVSRQ